MRSIAVAVLGVVGAAGLCAPAQAETTQTTAVVVKVTRPSTSAARVELLLRCPRLSEYSLSLEVLQDTTPNAAPFDAYYTGTRSLEGRCTGLATHFLLTAVADRSGRYAPKTGRLTKGLVDVVLGGSVGDEPLVLDMVAKAL